MTDKKKIASDSVKRQIATFTLQNAELTREVARLTDENKTLKKQNVELSSVIDNDLKADLKLKILAKSDFKESDLEEMTVEQLQQIEETLSKVKVGGSVYKTIRAGGASEDRGVTTVGCLYGKTRKQILEMGGDF